MSKKKAVLPVWDHFGQHVNGVIDGTNQLQLKCVLRVNT